jgi:hypothetical protein
MTDGFQIPTYASLFASHLTEGCHTSTALLEYGTVSLHIYANIVSLIRIVTCRGVRDLQTGFGFDDWIYSHSLH